MESRLAIRPEARSCGALSSMDKALEPPRGPQPHKPGDQGAPHHDQADVDRHGTAGEPWGFSASRIGRERPFKRSVVREGCFHGFALKEMTCKTRPRAAAARPKRECAIVPFTACFGILFIQTATAMNILYKKTVFFASLYFIPMSPLRDAPGPQDRRKQLRLLPLNPGKAK